MFAPLSKYFSTTAKYHVLRCIHVFLVTAMYAVGVKTSKLDRYISRYGNVHIGKIHIGKILYHIGKIPLIFIGNICS